MDIACPQCAAVYELDDSTVGPTGRKVRCAACGEVWRAMPAAQIEQEPGAETAAAAETAVTIAADGEAAATDAPPEAVGEPPAETAASEPEPPKPMRGARLIKSGGDSGKKASAWRKIADWRVMSVAVTALMLGAGLHQREAVVRLLPQTAKLYASVGFPVNLRGIEIRNVKSRLVVDNDEPVLVVDGDLVNVADRRVDVPRLHFALLAPDGRQIYVWSAQADRANLQPGETLNFRRRLAAPPAEAKNVSVRFLTRSDITAGIK